MKNLTKAFAIFLLISFTFAVNAQISIGPKAGINIATIGGDDSDGAESLLGFQIGLAAEIPITEKVAFQPELLYFQKGASDEDDDAKLFFNYIEVPLLAKINLGDGGSPGFFLTVGPSFGFGQKVKAEFNGDSEKVDFDEIGLKTFDLGLSIGLGASFAAGPGNLFIDARYLFGLTNIVDEDIFGEGEIKNRGVGIALGYLFPI